MADRFQVSAAVRTVAQQGAEALVGDVNGILAVVIATIDGFDVASSVRGSLEPGRTAALASSIAALGEVVAAEAGLGAARSVMVTTESGFAVVQAAARPDISLALIVIATGQAILGEVTYRAAEMARKLAAA